MLTVDQARERIVAGLHPTAPEIVALAEAWGRVTATDIVARRTQPPADVSAMDGYAVRAHDHGPLKVIGDAPAGHPFPGQVAVGEAVRLFTGSVVPHGADAVVIQEDAVRDGATVSFTAPPILGRHIRRQGQDFRTGDLLVPAATRLNARGVGLIAAGNHAWATVHRRPVVGILATGDEIVMPGDPVPDGGIVSSNAHALAALVRARGGQAIVLPIAPDRPEAIAAAAVSARGMDLLITTGGASVGEHDLVQAGLGREGFELDFWKVAMRPGKPLISGRLGHTAVLGLPGNPVSALVCAILFLIPALDRLQGLSGAAVPTVSGRLGAKVPANDHRADHLRATITGESDGLPVVEPFLKQDSSMLKVLHSASALIRRSPGAPALESGALVSIIRMDLLGV